VSGFLLIAVIALALAIIVAYRAGARSARNVHAVVTPELRPPVVVDAPDDEARSVAVVESRNPSIDDSARDTLEPLPSAELAQLREFGDDRRRLLSDLADARAEIARYRQIVIDIESNAPPPLLDAPGTPDDLKMIVGIGPVIVEGSEAVHPATSSGSATAVAATVRRMRVILSCGRMRYAPGRSQVPRASLPTCRAQQIVLGA